MRPPRTRARVIQLGARETSGQSCDPFTSHNSSRPPPCSRSRYFPSKSAKKSSRDRSPARLLARAHIFSPRAPRCRRRGISSTDRLRSRARAPRVSLPALVLRRVSHARARETSPREIASWITTASARETPLRRPRHHRVSVASSVARAPSTELAETDDRVVDIARASSIPRRRRLRRLRARFWRARRGDVHATRRRRDDRRVAPYTTTRGMLLEVMAVLYRTLCHAVSYTRTRDTRVYT